jgi:hypothetical protein
MSASDHLNDKQFKMTHMPDIGRWVDEGGNPQTDGVDFYPHHWDESPETITNGRHLLQAHTGNGVKLGSLSWNKGVVSNVNVNEGWQHRGMATQMWKKANEITPGLSHSGNRTDAGEGWASKVGGHKPPRWQDELQ